MEVLGGTAGVVVVVTVVPVVADDDGTAAGEDDDRGAMWRPGTVLAAARAKTPAPATAAAVTARVVFLRRRRAPSRLATRRYMRRGEGGVPAPGPTGRTGPAGSGSAGLRQLDPMHQRYGPALQAPPSPRLEQG